MPGRRASTISRRPTAIGYRHKSAGIDLFREHAGASFLRAGSMISAARSGIFNGHWIAFRTLADNPARSDQSRDYHQQLIVACCSIARLAIASARERHAREKDKPRPSRGLSRDNLVASRCCFS
jgi:hypothetical protein